MKKNKLVAASKCFLIEYFILLMLCILGFIVCIYYRKEFIFLFLIGIPVTIGYLIYFSKNLMKIIIDICNKNIVNDNMQIVILYKKKFEMIFWKKFYIVELHRRGKYL